MTLDERLNEIYSEALRKAIKNSREYLKTAEKLEKAVLEAEKDGTVNRKLREWRKEEMNKALRETKVIETIQAEMNKAGLKAFDAIQEELVTVYKANNDLVKKYASKYSGREFFLLNRGQVKAVLTETQPVFSKIAFQHLGQNLSVRSKLQREMAQAVLLGENQSKVIKRIRSVTGMSQYQAKRVAQTEQVRVRSQARYDAAQEASDAGVLIFHEWSTNMDGRERESHAKMDGQKVKHGEMFITGNGVEMRYPGDPNAPADEVINCRCVLIPDVLLPNERLENGKIVQNNSENRFHSGAESGIIKEQGIDIDIDELTPCLRRISDGTLVQTNLSLYHPKAKTKGFGFDWKKIDDGHFRVYALRLNGDDTIQGLVSMKSERGYIEVGHAEAADWNKFTAGDKRIYSGVGGHLFAEACRQSIEEGNGGFVAFTAKTKLFDYYSRQMGAQLLGGQRMVIDEGAALRLVERYFGGK